MKKKQKNKLSPKQVAEQQAYLYMLEEEHNKMYGVRGINFLPHNVYPVTKDFFNTPK